MHYKKLILQVLLVKVKLLCHLFSNWHHLLQQYLVLAVCAVGCESTATTSTGAFGKYDLIYAKTWFRIDFAKCYTYVAWRPGDSFKRSINRAILGLPG
jgi:hypothetical protein